MIHQLVIGSALIALTVFIHGFFLEIIIKTFRRMGIEHLSRWRALTLSLSVLCVFSAHVVEIWIWAVFFLFIEDISTLETALYFSTSTFTTVGYGDITLSENWRLLGSLESANGMILFGWSTAFIFEIVRRIHPHLREPLKPL